MELFRTRDILTAAVFAVAGIAGSSATAANLIVSGDINVAGNWDTGLPGIGETGFVNIDASWPATSAAGTLTIEGDLVFGGGSTLTAAIDVVGSNPNSVTFNDVTVNVSDDIFTGAGGNFIFNAGSVTNVGDDFEANAGGGATITVNGGTHTVGDEFGAQRGSVLNFLGGTVNSDGFRATAGNAGTPAGGTINIGGDATLNAANTLSLDSSGFIEFSNAWTGSLTVATLTGTDWQTALDGTAATFEGVAIDATVFADNFQITNGGQTLSLINPVPEPGSLALLGLGGLLIARRRRG